MESYLRVTLLGPGPRLMKKEFTGPRSHKVEKHWSKGHRRGNYEMIGQKYSCRILVVVLMHTAMWVLVSQKTLEVLHLLTLIVGLS
jgi:hypothetical protein